MWRIWPCSDQTGQKLHGFSPGILSHANSYIRPNTLKTKSFPRFFGIPWFPEVPGRCWWRTGFVRHTWRDNKWEIKLSLNQRSVRLRHFLFTAEQHRQTWPRHSSWHPHCCPSSSSQRTRAINTQFRKKEPSSVTAGEVTKPLI